MTDPFKDLVQRWRDDAEVLRRRGAEERADLLEQLADEAEEAFIRWWEKELSIDEAARWSGYSAERIRELVRDGKIPDRRPSGRSGRGSKYRIRRCDLPRHPLGKRDPDALPLPGREPEEGNVASAAQRAVLRAAGRKGSS